MVSGPDISSGREGVEMVGLWTRRNACSVSHAKILCAACRETGACSLCPECGRSSIVLMYRLFGACVLSCRYGSYCSWSTKLSISVEATSIGWRYRKPRCTWPDVCSIHCEDLARARRMSPACEPIDNEVRVGIYLRM